MRIEVKMREDADDETGKIDFFSPKNSNKLTSLFISKINLDIKDIIL
jgi:hypothetical protein